MFTGIITHTGQVREITPENGNVRLRLDVHEYPGELEVGSSHAINGVCLTLTSSQPPLSFDLSTETLDKTNMAHLQIGDKVNLEPAMKLGDSIDGHLVSGHVDAVGEVIELSASGSSTNMSIAFPPDLAKYIAIKGSICVDGASLTVNQTNGHSFSVTIIPHTLRNTRISDYQEGTQVNLEVDMLARYLERLLNERTIHS